PSIAHAPPTTPRSTLPLHDALPICSAVPPVVETGVIGVVAVAVPVDAPPRRATASVIVDAPASGSAPATPDDCCASCATFASARSEEHTSELQSHLNLVCRLLLAEQ